jgi:hypothetical protein
MYTIKPMEDDTHTNKYIQYAELLNKKYLWSYDDSVTDITPLIIDGLPVNLRFYIANNKHSFTIEAKRIMNGNRVGYKLPLYHVEYYGRNESKSPFLRRQTQNEFTVEEIADFIKILYNFIVDLKFDKYIGKFIDSEDIYTAELMKAKKKVYKDLMVEIHSCSVCQDLTGTKTHCGHSLCIICWEKLKTMVCPICRADITNKYTGDLDDD